MAALGALPVHLEPFTTWVQVLAALLAAEGVTWQNVVAPNNPDYILPDTQEHLMDLVYQQEGLLGAAIEAYGFQAALQANGPGQQPERGQRRVRRRGGV